MFFINMTILTDKIEQLAASVYNSIGGSYPYFTAVIRYLLPVLALIVVVRCAKSLLRERFEPEEWGILTMAGGVKYTLYHWENTIGRAKSSDVCINYPTVSRSHGSLIRDSEDVYKRQICGKEHCGRRACKSLPD